MILNLVKRASKVQLGAIKVVSQIFLFFLLAAADIVKTSFQPCVCLFAIDLYARDFISSTNS